MLQKLCLVNKALNAPTYNLSTTHSTMKFVTNANNIWTFMWGMVNFFRINKFASDVSWWEKGGGGGAGSSLHVGEGQYAPRGCDPEHPNASLGGWGRDIQSIIALKDNCGWGDFGEGGVRSMSFIEVGPVHPFACTQLGVERRCNAPRHTDWGENKKKKKKLVLQDKYMEHPNQWVDSGHHQIYVWHLVQPRLCSRGQVVAKKVGINVFRSPSGSENGSYTAVLVTEW